MRLSCTTLACPEWSLDEILTRFRQYGYDAVDFRGLGTTTEIFRMEEFTTNLAGTVKKVQKSGLPVSAFSSSANMFAATTADRDKWLEANQAIEYGAVDQILEHMPEMPKSNQEKIE